MTIKEKVKTLWQLCFDDNEEFVEMYLRLRYKNEINIAIESGGEIVSAPQMISYPMTFYGDTIQTSYTSGACTHPDLCGSRVVRELLSQTFAKMLCSGTYFSTLTPAEPWLFDYYTRMGYASIFQHSAREITVPEFTPPKGITVTSEIRCQKEVYEHLNSEPSGRTCCIQHLFEDFQVVMANLIFSGGILVTARPENQINGLAIVYRRDKQLTISEFFAETKDVEYSLLHHIKQLTGYRYTIQLPPPKKEQTQYPSEMARIIDAKEVLQLYAFAFPENEMQLEVLDKQLSVNSGYYYLCSGKCMYSTERLPGVHMSMNISKLTGGMFQVLQPHMSLMLNK